MVSSVVRLRVTCVACLFTGALVHTMCVLCVVCYWQEQKQRERWRRESQCERNALSLFLSECVFRVCIALYFYRVVSKVLVRSPYSLYARLYARLRRERKRKPLKKRVSASLRISFTSIHQMCVHVCVYVSRWMHTVHVHTVSLSLSHTIKSLVRFGVVWIVYDNEVQFIQSHSTDPKCCWSAISVCASHFIRV